MTVECTILFSFFLAEKTSSYTLLLYVHVYTCTCNYVHVHGYSHKRSLTHHPSSQGWASRCPLLHVYMFICLGCLPFFFSVFLKLVCYSCTCISIMCMHVSHPRQLGKVTALGVLCCFALFVCLTLLASFFLPSHLSFKNMIYTVHVVKAILDVALELPV